jgi:hypothetical protein
VTDLLPLLADALVVRQVDADGRDGARVAGLHHHLDGHCRHALHHGLAETRGNGHVVLEPLRVGGQRPDLSRLLGVAVVDDTLPRALDAAGVHVDLDEAVHRVHGRVVVLHPGDVERRAIVLATGLVEADERLEGGSEARRSHLGRVAQVADDAHDLIVVEATDPVDLLDEAPVTLHQPRVQRVTLGEALEVGHHHAVVQVVGAGLQDVAPARGRLVRGHRIERRVEEHRRETRHQLLGRLARRERQSRAAGVGACDRDGEVLLWEAQHELARRQVVIRAGVQPEEFGVARDLRQHVLGNPLRVRDDGLEDRAHRQVVTVALVVVDVAAGQGSLVEVPHEHLLGEWQHVEAVGVQLHDGRVVDLFEQVWPGVGGCEQVWHAGFSSSGVLGFSGSDSRFRIPDPRVPRPPSRGTRECGQSIRVRARCAPSAPPGPAARRARGR